MVRAPLLRGWCAAGADANAASALLRGAMLEAKDHARDVRDGHEADPKHARTKLRVARVDEQDHGRARVARILAHGG